MKSNSSETNSPSSLSCYDYLQPLYEKVDEILITGGDPFVAPESYNYMRFLSDNYPQTTIITESNGLPFGKEFQKLAAENLFLTHFSLNASNEDVFCRGCWPGEDGRTAYRKIMSNITNYIELLDKNGLMDFAPDYSMVINKDTADDVADFVAKVLKLGCASINMYFDYTESSMSDDYFGEPDTSRRALKTLLELEKLLEGKHFTSFKKSLVEEKGGFRSEYDGSQDHELYLRLTDAAEHIVHIPKALYYWREYSDPDAGATTNKKDAIDAGARAVEDNLRAPQRRAAPPNINSLLMLLLLFVQKL